MAMENQLLMKVEKTATWFSAYSQDYPIFTIGTSIYKLMKNLPSHWVLFWRFKHESKS